MQMARAIADNDEIAREARQVPGMTSRRGSVPDAGSDVVVLPAELIAALRQMAPKPRRSKRPYVIGLALLTVGVILGRSGVTRSLIAARWHRGDVVTSAPVTPVATPPAPVASSERVETSPPPQTAASSESTTTKEAISGAKKPRRRKDTRVPPAVRR